MAKHRKRRRDGWGLFLLFWTLLLLAVGLVICVFFYRYASAYEDTRPEKVMDGLMDSMSTAQWREALLASAGEVGEFEDGKALYASYFDGAVQGRTISYRRDLGRSDSEQTVFTVYAGPARLGEVRLVPVEGTRIDFVRREWSRCEWKLDAITASRLTDTLQAVTVVVDAPDGMEVFINGRPLRQELIIDPAVSVPTVNELEARFPRQPRLVRYAVTPLYGEIVVTDGEGNEIAPYGALEDGVCRYVIEPKETYSFNIEAPEGVEVSVCGAVLGEGEITSREKNMFRHLENFVTDSWYETVHYAADGLYSVPEIRASYEGRELTPVIGENGKYFFFYPSDANADWTMRSAAEGFFNAYMEYSSYKYNGGALMDLLGRILYGTDLYSNVNNSYDAMVWASATEVKYEELKFDNFHFVRDDCFTCSIYFKADYTATTWYEQHSYSMQDGYKMVFVRRNGVWYAAAMNAFES